MTDKYQSLREELNQIPRQLWKVQHPNEGGRGWEVADSSGLNQIADYLSEKIAGYIAAASPAVIADLLAEREALREALENAARSLRTISKKAGIDEFMSEMCEVRGYAESRAWCAEKDLAAFRQGGES